MRMLYFTPNLGCCSWLNEAKDTTLAPAGLHSAPSHNSVEQHGSDCWNFNWACIVRLTLLKLHCAKSHKPFELFANENYELQNEAKVNVTFERGSAQDLSVQSSLCWDERCFYVKNRRASCGLVIHLGMTCLLTIARVAPSRTKCVLSVLWRLKHAAVILHVCLVLDAVLRDLLHCLWRVGRIATTAVTCAEERIFNECLTNEWVPHEDTPCMPNCRQFGVLQNICLAGFDQTHSIWWLSLCAEVPCHFICWTFVSWSQWAVDQLQNVLPFALSCWVQGSELLACCGGSMVNLSGLKGSSCMEHRHVRLFFDWKLWQLQFAELGNFPRNLDLL